MKYITISIFLAFTLFLFGQNPTKSMNHELKLSKDLISEIEISNYCGPMDSCAIFTYKLTRAMTEGLIDRLNIAKPSGPCEFTNVYWLNIHFKDHARITYITNGFLFYEVQQDDRFFYTTVIEADDLCLKSKDPLYVKNLWNELDQDREN